MEGRLRKAERFMDAAGVIHELADTDEDAADAYVTLCVHAGIAASDVICCTSLGGHAQGESHSDAVDLLKDADVDASRYLRALLGLKTKSGYSHMPVTPAEARRAGRAATSLVEKARRARASAGR
jgi:acetyl-CoA carboxylase carboxyltransferase component